VKPGNQLFLIILDATARAGIKAKIDSFFRSLNYLSPIFWYLYVD